MPSPRPAPAWFPGTPAARTEPRVCREYSQNQVAVNNMSPIIITHRILLEINFYSVCEVRLDSKVYCVLLQLLHLGVHCEVQKAVGTLESQSLYIRDNLESVVRLASLFTWRCCGLQWGSVCRLFALSLSRMYLMNSSGVGWTWSPVLGLSR